MMNQVYKILPDDRPITALCVVEDVDRCPEGYIPISKTFDQDADADLWRESGFFGRKCTRYLCLSKTQGAQDYVIQSLAIINEKGVPPQGYKTISKTSDSDQRAWRKKQLCFKFAHISSCQTAITYIIVLSKSKKAPEEFLLSGEINGMTLCFKTGKVTAGNQTSLYPNVPYPVLPYDRENPNANHEGYKHNYQNLPSRSSQGEGGAQNNGSDNLRPLLPLRPAPKPPVSSYATISGYNGLEGVPFILNPKLNLSGSNPLKDLLLLKPKKKSQVDLEYSYEFRTERET